MDRLRLLIAAATYDAWRDEADERNRAPYASVELDDGWHRAVLCDISLSGEPPVPLCTAVDDTMDLLRATWIAMLKQKDDAARTKLDAIHAALQHELAEVERHW